MRCYVVLLLPCLLFAQPKSHNVIKGAVHMKQEGSTLNITASDRSIIHWQDFSIHPGETVRFMQPHAKAAVLNRVVAQNPSLLLGSLKANGKVFLINPHGILFGKGCRFDVGALIASTLDINDDLFLSGADLAFEGDSLAEIRNQGELYAEEGDIILVSRLIENSGSITAPQGTVGLAAGREVLIRPHGQQKIFIRPHSNSQSHLLNEGSIKALSIEVKTEGNPYAFAFKHTGEMDALVVEEKGGEIFLVADTGQVTVDGQIKGRDIQVLGEYVALMDYAMLDASSPSNGGRILIGGDYQGKNPAVLNAKRTMIAQKASIRADSLEKGCGGRVIIWGDELAAFYGNASVQGGPQGGDGGFVEISSPGHLDFFKGIVNARAPLGKAGNLLIDPSDITINGVGPTTGTFSACMSSLSTYTPGAQTDTILSSDIATQLATCNVEIQTNSAFSGSGDITFATSLIWTEETSLTLRAQRNITLTDSCDIQANAGGSTADLITMIADSNVVGTGDVFITDGRVSAVRGSINIQGYNINMNCVNAVAFLSGTNITLTAQNDINIATSDVSASDSLGIQSQSGAPGTIRVTAGGNINIICGSIGNILIGASFGGTSFLAGKSFFFQGNTPPPGIGSKLVSYFSANGPQSFIAGENVIFNSGSPLDVNGTSRVAFALEIEQLDPSSTQTFVALADLLFHNGNGYDNGVFFTSSFLFGGQSTYGNMLMKAGGDLLLGTTIDRKGVQPGAGTNPVLTNTISILADHAFAQGEAWSAQTDPRLAGTPLATTSGNVSTVTGEVGGDGFGGFIIQDAFLGPASSGQATTPSGIQLITVDGDITITSGAKFANGTGSPVGSPVNFLFGDVLQLSGGLLPVDLVTTGGDITVDPFNDITVLNTVTTTGSIEIVANHSLSLAQNGALHADKYVRLVVDNAAPTPPLIGSGGFFMTRGTSIFSGGALEIYTARQRQNLIEGTLNGIAFQPGVLFFDTPQEQWNSYFARAFNAIPFTVFYKDSGVPVTTWAQTPLDELFDTLRRFYPYWPEVFSVFYSDTQKQEYFLRHQEKLKSSPRSYLQ